MIDENSKRVLVVEDDAALAQWIVGYLTKHGFAVTLATNGDEAVDAVRAQQPDVLLLDIMLPRKNGFDVCRDVRDFCLCPILMMTACDEEDNELLSFELGADDYINKPVRPKVLLARVKALLRRTVDGPPTDQLVFNALTIKKQTKSVQLMGEDLPISANEFDVLWLLAARAGEVISREELVRQLRGIDYDGFDRSIDIRVSRLRKKLLDDPEQPVKIKTIWGKGYVFMRDAW